MVLWKRKRPLIFSKWNSAGVKTSVSFLKLFNTLITWCGRSKRPYFHFFNRLPAPLDVRSKSLIFFSKTNRTFVLNRNLDKFLFGQSLLMVVDRDWILKIKIIPTDFSSGWFCWTRDQRIIKPRMKKQQEIFKSALFRKKLRTTNIGKGWPNRNHEKISGQNQTLFEKENFGKIFSNTFCLNFFKREFMIHKVFHKLWRKRVVWRKFN